MKRLLLLGLLLIAGAAQASWHSVLQVSVGAAPVMMVTPVLAVGGSNSSPSNSATNYTSPSTGSITGVNNWAANTTILGKGYPMPVSGTIANLYVFFPIALSQGSYTVGIYKAYSLTASVCSVNIIDTTHFLCSDTVHTVSVSPGDIIAIGEVPSGTPTAAFQTPISFTFTSTVGQESPLFFGLVGSNVSASALGFFGVGAPNGVGSDANRATVMPSAGVLDTMYVQQTAATSAGATYSYFLYKNGAQTALTCTVVAAADHCNTSNGVNPITFAAGDTASVEVCPSTAAAPLDTNCVGSAAAPTAVAVRGAFRWVPTTQNEAIVVQVSSTLPTTTATRYVGINGAGQTADTADASDWNIAPIGMTVKNLRHSQDVSPGGATNRTLTLRGGTTAIAAAPGTSGSQAGKAVTCNVTSAATTCSDLTHTYSPIATELIDWETSVSGTNAALAWFKNSATVTVP